jgi:hypothetical protein
MAEDDFIKEVRETVTILRPMKSVYVRGQASPKEQAPAFSVRFHDDMLVDVKLAASLLGVTLSEFIRWTSHAVALDIIRQKNEYDKRHGES